MMRIQIIFSLAILGLSLSAWAGGRVLVSDGLKTVIRFDDQPIKTLDASEIKYSATSVDKMISDDSRIYDAITEKMVTVKSSPQRQLQGTGVDNGLLGSMFLAYSNHIPLSLRPDDVWLTIGAAFANYVVNHPDQMHDLLVTTKEKQKLTVSMSGSLAMSDEAFWKAFTDKMLVLAQNYTKDDLRQWLVPNFSTTNDHDRLVGNFVMMGALKNYFGYGGILSCAVTQLTLQGTLKDWQELRNRAAQLKQYGAEMATWADVLIPVLDQFVAAYQGKIDDDFWQRMITYKRIGSGGNKIYRGWFLVFSPFDKNGKYLLNSKADIDKTGIYATVVDSRIFHATVQVPVDLDDNGMHHDLLFFGGVTAASYDLAHNTISPSVDWAISDKVKLSNAEVLDNAAREYLYTDYDRLDSKYRVYFTKADYDVKAADYRSKSSARTEARQAEIDAEEKARLDAILNSKGSEQAKKIAEAYSGYGYEHLSDQVKNLISEKDFNAACEAQGLERAKKRVSELLALPKDELINRIVGYEMMGRFVPAKYADLAPEIKNIVSEAEFNNAVSELVKKDGWE